MHKQFSLQTQILFYADNCYFLYPKIHVRSLPVEIETLELKLLENFKSNKGTFSLRKYLRYLQALFFFSIAQFYSVSLLSQQVNLQP